MGTHALRESQPRNTNFAMGVLQEIEHHILPSTQIASHYGTPSASIAILENDDLETHVFGQNNEDCKTLYLADSLSKPVTAIAVARLVDRGLLTWESKLADFANVESFLHHPESASLIRYVTVQMLLTHTSGLVRKSNCDHPSHLHGFSRYACLRFNHLPGSEWHYDNEAYALVQLAMEAVSGKSLLELINDLVARPLRMTRSSWGRLPPEESNYTLPHHAGKQLPLRTTFHDAELSTRGMWSTPSDLLKVISASQKSLLGSSSFLRQETARHLLIDGVRSTKSVGESPQGLGVGWFVTSSTFGHRGGAAGDGHHCYMFGFHGGTVPELQNTSFAAMTNSSEGIVAIRAILNAVMYLKLWPRQQLMPSSLGLDDTPPCAAPDTASLDSQWQEWVGKWARDSQRGCKAALQQELLRRKLTCHCRVTGQG